MRTYYSDSITKIKWLLPLLFFFGYFFTAKSFEENFFEYLAYTLLAVASCVVLLTRIDLFDEKFVAVWVALILLLVVYFVRFYWITIDALPVKRMLPHNSYFTMVVDRNALLAAFELSVVAFAGFSFTVVAVLFVGQKGSVNLLAQGNNSPLFGLIARRSLLITSMLLIFLAYISAKFHIGEMGATSGEALPFRMKGVIFYARTMLIPLVLLLSIYLAERGSDLITSRLGVLILVSNGVIDMLLRNSRSALLLALLLLVFLMLANGIKLRRKEKVFFGILVMLAFFMVPIMTEYRSVRTIYSLPHLDAFASALNSVGKDWLTQILKGLEFVLFRMPGLEALWNMIALRAEPLGIYSIDVIKSKNGIAGYLTYVIHPMKESDNTLLAPGFVGWLYLVAGLPAIVLGSIFAGFLTLIGWRYLDRRYMESGPVAQVFFLWMLFLALTEGTLDSMINIFLVGVITIVAMELSLRLLLKKAFCNNLNL